MKMCMSDKPCWKCWEKVSGDHLQNMREDDLDYAMMQKVYKMIQQQQSIDHIIRDYNETYFRELMWTLKQKAASWCF